jgi:hypothetical protein
MRPGNDVALNILELRLRPFRLDQGGEEPGASAIEGAPPAAT